MKELKEYFTGRGQVKGYIFNQIKRTDYAYLYEVLQDGRIHYEVFKRKENTLYDCVSYPTDKAFGVWAFTCMTRDSAFRKLIELTREERLRLEE
jgi:hypothetical protein